MIEKMLKGKSGITMIALAVTIVVIIIIASITIATLTGDEGVINEAREAKKSEQEEDFNEAVNLYAFEYERKITQGEIQITKLIEKLQAKGYNAEIYMDKYVEVYYEAINAKKYIDLETAEVIVVREYTEEELAEVIDISIWDGTSSMGLIGEGTILNPYLICSARDFSYMRDQINSKLEITGLNIDRTENGCNVDAAIANYKMVTDVYLNDTTNFDSWDNTTEGLNEWIPIGNVRYSYNPIYYTGIFNGNNHKIVGTYVIVEKDSKRYQGGIFGSVKDGKISNVIAEKTYVYSEVLQEGLMTRVGNVGSIIGNAECQEIYNCKSIDARLYGSQYIGGIVGILKAYKYAKTPIVEKCYFEGEIQLLTSAVLEVRSGIGGICGGLVGSTKGYVKNSWSNGTIIINNSSEQSLFVGGIAGLAHQEADIEDCYNIGNIEVTYAGTSMLGGICGYTYNGSSASVNIFSNCYNTGTIKGGTYQGGIIGCTEAVNKGKIIFSNCYNVGNIENEDIIDGNVNLLIGIQGNYLQIVNNYMLLKGSIYKHEYTYSTGAVIESIQSEADESYFYNTDFIKNTLGWDESIWNITGNSHPTLK